MPSKQRMREHRKRWNIELEDGTEFLRFQNRLVAALEQVHASGPLSGVLGRIDDRFAFNIGEPTYHRDELLWDHAPPHQRFAQTRISGSVLVTSSLEEVADILQRYLWAVEHVAPQKLDRPALAIRAAVKYSPTIDLRLMVRDGMCTLYPAGARLLDDALVNDILEWLEPYPKVEKHFREALQIYLVKDAAKYRNLLDDLRFSLEQLLRSVLGNQKSLENQTVPLGQWLKDRDVHSQIRNMYHTLLTQFTAYQNDAVKHGEAFSPSELEFMIYLTGTFMRLILQLDSQESDE